MTSLNAVLKFIDLSGMTATKFESLAKLQPGTIDAATEASAELANADIIRIIARLGPALMNHGFDIIAVKGLPGQANEYIITEKDLNLFCFGNKPCLI